MKLLVVTPEYPPDYGGGIATLYGALLPELVRQGHAVDVLVGSAFEPGRPAYERDGVRVSTLEPERRERLVPRFARYAAAPQLQRHLAAAWAMWEQAAGAGYDAVEATDWGFLFAPWVVREGPPALVQLHGSTGQIDWFDPLAGEELQGELERLIEAGVLAAAPTLQTYSRANAARWEVQTGRPVAYCPPPLGAAVSGGPRPEGPPADTGFVAGRIQRWKGPDVLCEALRLLGADAPVVEWAGRDTPSEQTGVTTAARLARAFPDVWGERVKPIGQLAPDEVARRQARAAFVVVPSEWDVFNLTAVEAMRAGAVLICSTGAGAVDVVEDGVNGFAFPAGDAEALAACIRRARALAPAERAALTDAARQTVAERLDVRAVAAERVRQYEAMTRGGGTGSALSPWVARAASPDDRAAPLAFLDHLPLRGLAQYVVRRSWRKASATLGRKRSA